MSGIIALAFLTTWFFIANKLTKFFTSKIYLKIKGKWIYPVVFVLVFLTPVADEIIGGFQFRALCTPENMLIYDAKKIKGRSVQYKAMPSYNIDKIINITVVHSQWVAPQTGEVLIEHRMFHAKSGWLYRLVGLTGFGSLNGHCDLKEYYELFEKLEIKKLSGRYGE